MPPSRASGLTARARRLAARASVVALGTVLVGLLAPVLPAAAAEPDYPSYDSRYHTNAEMVAEIHAAEAAYSDLVDVMSIGKSYRGRDIWVAKISDNVAIDEAEPEVMVDALHHARERLSLEQALYLLKTLTGEYATDPRIRSLVDAREIWILFSVNPDGHVYDLGGNPYRLWRKNRQPTPGSRYVGTDLNRNYDYRWGCCRGSSSNPADWIYRGPAPFSAPETRAVRDFVNSRVVDGQQQIRIHLTLHTNGEQVLWPYGYTKTNVPADMTLDDQRAFVAIGRQMAARNGYRPMQSSDLYVTDGDEIDWMYGRHRIFSFTWELYPKETPSDATDHYSPDEIIARETKRNRVALIYTLRVAGCPYDVIDRGQANCGAFFDNFEGSKGWTVDPDGTDTAVSGPWQRANPAPTSTDGLPGSSTRRSRGAARSPPGRRPARSPAPTTSTGRRPSDRHPSRCRPASGRSRSATTWPTMRPPRPTTGCGSGWRRPTARAPSWSRSWVQRTTTRRRGRRRGSRWPRGPGRRCASSSGPPTRAPTASSRPPSTTSGSSVPDRAGKARTPAGGPGFSTSMDGLGCGEGIRTLDLRVMSPTSCRCSTPLT